MMNDWNMGWGGSGMFFGPLFWIGIVAFAVIVALSMPRQQGTGRVGTPRETLDARLANGEIDSEEYKTRRKALD